MERSLTPRHSHYIEFEHIYKTFDRPVLVDVNFHVDAGETLAVIGRSGVGKSVSLGHIMGFIKPDAGRIHVAYTDMTDESDAEWRRIRKKVTMVFQSGALFDSLTVGENILFSLELTSIRRIYPPDTSGQWPSRAPWPRSPNASSTMNRPPWSTPS
jgi:ABC-type transporter Mla maintaining outer membrane lipid asymmetry ATPase subunit MlaF